jgi:Alcohol dehydrogenase GroES-like domain
VRPEIRKLSPDIPTFARIKVTTVKAGSTYRAVHVVSPGKLELTDKPLLDPNPGHVRIRLEACGVCHSDSFTVEGAFPIEWPRVPGHEAVGRIDMIGAGARLCRNFSLRQATRASSIAILMA